MNCKYVHVNHMYARLIETKISCVETSRTIKQVYILVSANNRIND